MAISIVLIIDDEADARNVLRKMLGLFCPQVTTILEAKNEAEALKKAQQHQIGLALIDIDLRGENGFQLGQKIRSHCQKLAFVTGHEVYNLPTGLIGNASILSKPVLPEQLLALVLD